MYVKRPRFLMSYDTLVRGVHLVITAQIVFQLLYGYIIITGSSFATLHIFLDASRLTLFVINYLCVVRILLHRVSLFSPSIFIIKDNCLYTSPLIFSFTKVYEGITQGFSINERRLWFFTKIICFDLLWLIKLAKHSTTDETYRLLSLSEVTLIVKQDNGTLFHTVNNVLFVSDDIVSFDGVLLADEMTATLKNRVAVLV